MPRVTVSDRQGSSSYILPIYQGRNVGRIDESVTLTARCGHQFSGGVWEHAYCAHNRVWVNAGNALIELIPPGEPTGE